MKKDSKIYVAGHTGLAGSAVCRALHAAGYNNVLTKLHSELDLKDQVKVSDLFAQEHPEYVVMCAARVGGIHDNASHRWDFVYDNLVIQNNIITSAFMSPVKRLIFLGSSCIYPRMAEQPIIENSLLSGPLEPTNRSYAVAKIAGIEMCLAAAAQHGKNFLSLIPCNMYGPNDRYSGVNAHVIPALLVKFRSGVMNNEPYVVCWGSGTPKREFLHSDDFGRAVVSVLEHEGALPAIMNVGSGVEHTIEEVVHEIRKITKYSGNVYWDHDRPDGTPRKIMMSDKIRKETGWEPKISLSEGLESVYRELLAGSEV